MDYLARQAARSLSRTARTDARPRLAGRFEPAAGGETFESITVERDAPPAVPPPPPEAAPRSAVVETLLRREAERVQTLIERTLPPPPRGEAGFSPPAERPVERPPREIDGGLKPASPLVQREIVREVPVTRVERVEREVHEVREPQPVPRTIIDERITRIVERSETAPAAPVAVEPRVQPLPARVLPPIPVAARPMQPALRPIEEPASTIHVTIGRVDVRAIVSSEAPARPAPAPPQPSLSLDDYLKQREGRVR